MNDIKILYYLKSSDNDIFIELKRLKFKKSNDKSKYVSWFRISDNIPKILNFVKMKDNTRFFKEGKIIINDNNNNNLFIDKKECLNLKYCYINIDIIQRCLDIWN